MKKILLTILAALTILFAQAQCQADFSYLQNGPTTIFTDLSTINSGWSTNYSVTWDWDLGDGNSSTQQNPIHTYASPGPNNGWYWSCLIVTYFDSTTINSCTSFYCDTIIIGNSIPASWNCNPTGCYDPFTGLGQYSTLAACQAACGAPTPSWDCSPNSLLGCYDPGTGLGQYSSLAACQAACVTPTPSWDCGPIGCYDPGTGVGQYTTLAACQSICASTVSNLCDSMIVNGSINQPIFEVMGINTFIDYWLTTSNDGVLFQEDSMSTYQMVYNFGTPTYDTLTTCITYNMGTIATCCVQWVFDSVTGMWARMGNITSIGEIGLSDKKLIKVVDLLGRETSINNNQILFFIYEDGTIEKYRF